MKKRKLGDSGLEVSPLAFGGNVFGWTADETMSFRLLDAFDRLIQDGKVRAIGASNFSAKRLAEALQVSEQYGYPRYQSLQPLFNLYETESERG